MTTRDLPHIRKAIYSQPWAITEGWLESICEIFESNCAGGPVNFKADLHNGLNPEEPEYQVVNGIAILPIMGPIFPRANLMTQLSGATSLDVLGRRIDDAAENPLVETILFLIDSPGGSVMGLSEMATKIYDLRDSGIGTIAFAEGTAASAAYMLGSQAEIFLATEGSVVGSIGTIARIDSADRAMKNQGIDSIVLRSGELKAAGNGPLTPNQENSLRKVLNTYFEMFKAAVIRGRPSISIDEVATGEVWIGQQAVSMGLVDEISTLQNALDAYGNSQPSTVA